MTTATSRAGSLISGEGLRSAVALPIHVDGRLWGAIAVGSGQAPLPPGTEQRMTRVHRPGRHRGRERAEPGRAGGQPRRARPPAGRAGRAAPGGHPGGPRNRPGRGLLGGRRGNPPAVRCGQRGHSPLRAGRDAVVVCGAGDERPGHVAGRDALGTPRLPSPGGGVADRPARPGRRGRVERRGGPDRRPPARARDPVDGRPARSSSRVACGARWARRRGKGRFLPAPPTAWRTSPSWSRRPSGTPRAGLSWPPRGRGSSRPRIRSGGGSSGTCTTGPSSGWSRSAWSCAWRRAWCPPSWPGWRRRSARSRTS